MSYLDLPRLHFSGRFQTDPSTINNYASNYALNYVKEDPSSQRLKWNPNGSHAWAFRDCRVTRVCYADGTTTRDPGDDPVIGAPFIGAAEDYPAKITSLDVENQITYELWGFNKVGVDGGAEAGSFRGNFRVTQGAEGWQRVPMPDQLQTNNPYTTARFLSVLERVRWQQSHSRFLHELEERSDHRLALNFVCDGYSEDPYAKGGLGGRVVGTVGPAIPGEPAHFIGGRLLRPTGFEHDNPFLGSPCFFAPFQVESGRRVSVDLGNSIPTTLIGGPPPDLGELRLVIRRRRVEVGQPLEDADDLGAFHYRPRGAIDSSLYLDHAFVQDFAWKDGADDTPLALVRVAGGKVTHIYLEEDAAGRYLIAEIPPQRLGEPGEFMGEGIAIRMNPDDVVRVNVRAYVFGRPTPDVAVDLAQSVFFLDKIAGDQGKGGAPGTPPVGVPEDALAIISCDPDGKQHGQVIHQVVTDGDGRAVFCLRADDPLVKGRPPRYDGRLDGQVYTIDYRWAEGPTMPADPWNVISVKIYNSFKIAGTPTWKDIQPIFAQYGKLYPYMRNIVNLTSYEAVSQPRTAEVLKTVLAFPIDHPNHMPVTRDLARDKREAIIDWIELGLPLK